MPRNASKKADGVNGNSLKFSLSVQTTPGVAKDTYGEVTTWRMPAVVEVEDWNLKFPSSPPLTRS